jgi:glycosyltransferase involved in cell wall biosynthesis
VEVTVVGVSPEIVKTIGGSPNHEGTVDSISHVPQIILPAAGLIAWVKHWQTFQRLRPDIIHFNLCTPWACAIAQSAALILPDVRTVRVDQLPLRTTDAGTLWQTRALALRVDAHVAVGEASARKMEDFYALGRHSVISIPNGVPDVGPDPAAVPMTPDAEMVVGSVGRLSAMKAHDVLLRAIAKVEGVFLILVGDGEERGALERLAKELGVSDRLHITGWVEQPQAYLPIVDVVALPSRSEGFPLAMVEAMLAARPVVATRVGSMPEAVIHGETGLLIEKNDVPGLVNALTRLRDDPLLRSHLGKQAREMALAQFTADAMVASYEWLWHELVTVPAKPRLKVGPLRD